MEKRGRQIFSKIVRASKLTRQRTLQINFAYLTVAAVDNICKKRPKNFLTHGELTETKKALLFFSSSSQGLFNNINFAFNNVATMILFWNNNNILIIIIKL